MTSAHYTTAAVVIVAFALAAIAVRIARGIVQRVLRRLDIVSSENRAAVQARGRQLLSSLTLLAYGLAAVASI